MLHKSKVKTIDVYLNLLSPLQSQLFYMPVNSGESF